MLDKIVGHKADSLHQDEQQIRKSNFLTMPLGLKPIIAKQGARDVSCSISLPLLTKIHPC